MDLERRQGDRAHLDKTFRAAHSLKGAAAMVGLEPIARFTHGIEAVLDKIRAGSLGGRFRHHHDTSGVARPSGRHGGRWAAGSPVPGSGELSQRLSDLLRVRPPGSAAAPSQPAPQPAGPSQPGSGTAAKQPLPEVPTQTSLPPPAADPVASQPKPHDAAATRGNGTGAPPSSSSVPAPAPAIPPIEPRPRRARGKKKAEAAAKSGPRRVKSRAMDKAGSTGAAGHGPPAPTSGQDLPEDSSSRSTGSSSPGAGHPSPGRQSAGRARRAARAGRGDHRHRSATCPLLERARPGAVLPELDDHGPDRSRAGAVEGCFPLRLRGQHRARSSDGPPMEPSCRCRSTRRYASGPAAAVATPVFPPLRVLVPGGRVDRRSRPRRSDDRRISADNGAQPRLQPRPASRRRPGTQVGGLSPFPGARPHARIRVDAGAARRPGRPGRRAGGRVRQPAWACARSPGVGLAGCMHSSRSSGSAGRSGTRPSTCGWSRSTSCSRGFPRVVRDLADRSGKEIELRIIGQETRLDRTIVERLSDPMIHLIRNAVDHALETPAGTAGEGQAAGRPDHACRPATRGTGWRSGSRTTAGGSTARRSSARGSRWGMVPPGTSPDDPRVVSLIFEPGFSTRDTVSELSGRGVGLDVVRDAVRALRGSVAVESTPGKGTAFIFRLPLTLALIDGLLVETAGGQVRRPAGPGRGMRGARTARARPWRRERPCVAVRGELVPMVSLRNLFRCRRPVAGAAGIAADAARRPAGRRGRRPAAWAASRRSSSRWARACTASTVFPEPPSWATAPYR